MRFKIPSVVSSFSLGRSPPVPDCPQLWDVHPRPPQKKARVPASSALLRARQRHSANWKQVMGGAKQPASFLSSTDCSARVPADKEPAE